MSIVFQKRKKNSVLWEPHYSALYIYIHTHMYVCMYTHICIYTNVYVCVYIYACRVLVRFLYLDHFLKLKCIWHVTLCKFKVYSLLTSYVVCCNMIAVVALVSTSGPVHLLIYPLILLECASLKCQRIFSFSMSPCVSLFFSLRAQP